MSRQGLLPEAATMLDRAILLWREVRPLQVEDLAGALHERARIAYLQGDLDLALRLETDAIAVVDAAGGPDQVTLAALLNALSVMQLTSGQKDAATASLERATAILRPGLPVGQVYYANSMRNLAMQAAHAVGPRRASRVRPKRSRICGRQSPRGHKTFFRRRSPRRLPCGNWRGSTRPRRSTWIC